MSMFKVANSKGTYSPAQALVDSSGQIVVSPVAAPATPSALNITAATVVKATPGRVLRVNVIVAGTGAGTVNDVTTTGAAAAANQVATIPIGVANLLIDFPCAAGIVVVPGVGQTLAVSYS